MLVRLRVVWYWKRYMRKNRYRYNRYLVFYVNLASLFQKQAALETYQLLIGSAVLLLIASLFLYGDSHMEGQKYRRKLSQIAFGCMMVASFVRSG